MVGLIKKNKMKKLIVSLVVIAFTLQSCSTCHSRRRAQNRKWYVEVGAKKYVNKKIKSIQKAKKSQDLIIKESGLKEKDEKEMLILNQIEFNNQLIKANDEAANNGVESALEANDKILEDTRQLYIDLEQLRELDAKTQKMLKKELEEQIVSIGQDTLNASFSLYQDNLNRQLAISNQKYNEEIRLADGNQQKITEIEERRAAKDKEIALKQFRAGQLQAIAQAGFQAAPYIVKYTALLPASTANLLLTIGALSAQTAFILAQQPPEFYKGVENFEGGFAKVGERGSELIETPKGSYLSPDKPTLTYLPKGTNVITASKTKERMQILNSTYKKGQDQFQTIDTSPIAAELSKMPVAINRFDENGFTQFVRKGNRTTQILNKRKNY